MTRRSWLVWDAYSGLVLYDDATEQAGAFHDEAFLRALDVGRLLIGFVHECAEQADAFHGYQPVVRKLQFAAHEGHGLDGGGSPSMSAWRRSI